MRIILLCSFRYVILYFTILFDIAILKCVSTTEKQENSKFSFIFKTLIIDVHFARPEAEPSRAALRLAKCTLRYPKIAPFWCLGLAIQAF